MGFLVDRGFGEVVLASVKGRATATQQFGNTEMHAVMAEVAALRTILLKVLFSQANGETLTAEQVQTLRDALTPTR